MTGDFFLGIGAGVILTVIGEFIAVLALEAYYEFAYYKRRRGGK